MAPLTLRKHLQKVGGGYEEQQGLGFRTVLLLGFRVVERAVTGVACVAHRAM